MDAGLARGRTLLPFVVAFLFSFFVSRRACNSFATDTSSALSLLNLRLDLKLSLYRCPTVPGGGGKAKLPPVQVVRPAVVHQAWHGAAVIGSFPNVLDRFITKDMYEENGPSLIHKMCFQ